MSDSVLIITSCRKTNKNTMLIEPASRSRSGDQASAWLANRVVERFTYFSTQIVQIKRIKRIKPIKQIFLRDQYPVRSVQSAFKSLLSGTAIKFADIRRDAPTLLYLSLTGMFSFLLWWRSIIFKFLKWRADI